MSTPREIESSSKSAWFVLLDSIAEQAASDQPLLDAETLEQLEKEWAPYLVMPTEMIQ